jgi:hypothetical protein
LPPQIALHGTNDSTARAAKQETAKKGGRSTGFRPQPAQKEGKETEREEIVSPPERIGLGYPKSIKPTLKNCEYFLNLFYPRFCLTAAGKPAIITG